MRGRPARQREIYRRLQDDERERERGSSENEARRMLLIFLITSQPRAPSSWLCAIKLDESLASQVPNYVLVYTGGTRNEQLGGGVRTSSPAGSNAAMRSPLGFSPGSCTIENDGPTSPHQVNTRVHDGSVGYYLRERKVEERPFHHHPLLAYNFYFDIKRPPARREGPKLLLRSTQ